MKRFKKILVVIAVVIAIPLVAALFVTRDYHVEREVTINRPNESVFPYVKMLRNQDYFNKWIMADPAAKKQFKGTDGTVGFRYAWNGNDEVGEGEEEIKSVTEGKRMDYEVRFVRPMENVANCYIETEPVGPGQTKVKWVFAGKSAYPMNVMNMLVDKILGRDMATSLNNLKGILEKG